MGDSIAKGELSNTDLRGGVDGRAPSSESGLDSRESAEDHVCDVISAVFREEDTLISRDKCGDKDH